MAHRRHASQHSREDAWWQELSHYIVRIEIDGVTLPVLSLQGLLLTKEGLRDKDKADRAVLLQALTADRS